jgi:putative pyruvate formate lyase activating enzyme
MMAGASDRKGGLIIEDGILRQGLIMRHLVIPGELEASKTVLKWYSENLKGRALLSLMVQYTAMDGRTAAISEADYQNLMDLLEMHEIDEGFVQSPEASDEEWIPDFRKRNPFPAEFSEPVWHWKEGLIK